MEGTQPSAAGGDGAPTAMVAVPGLSGALTQGYTFLGGSGTVSMEASTAFLTAAENNNSGCALTEPFMECA